MRAFISLSFSWMEEAWVSHTTCTAYTWRQMLKPALWILPSLLLNPAFVALYLRQNHSISFRSRGLTLYDMQTVALRMRSFLTEILNGCRHMICDSESWEKVNICLTSYGQVKVKYMVVMCLSVWQHQCWSTSKEVLALPSRCTKKKNIQFSLPYLASISP